MAVQVEVVSDSEKARRDLDLLRNAILQIKVAASNFNFNPFSDKAASNTKAAAESLNKITESSKKANEAFKQFNTVSKESSDTLGSAAKNYDKVNRTADSLKTKQSDVNKTILETNRQARDLESTTGRVVAQFNNLAKAAIGVATAYVSTSTYMAYTDTITALTSKLQVSTKSQGEFNAALKATREIATDTRSGLTEVTDLYTKLTMSTTTFVRSQEDIARVTATVGRAVALSGSSAESAAAAVMQLGQAFASGILQGDELRSISENASQLMQTIADGFGKTVGQVRQLGAEGKLTSESLFKSILSQANVVEGRFAKVGVTFAQSFTNVKTSTLILFSEINKALVGGGGNGGGRGGPKGIPDHINDIAKAISSFAENIGWNILRLRVEAFLLFLDVRKFLEAPLEVKLKAARLTVQDIFPSQDSINQFFYGAVSTAKSSIEAIVSAIVGSPQKRATGGRVYGPGNGTSDSIPAMLSNGEFVVNAKATSENLAVLEAINNGRRVRHFATGGHVDSMSSNAENWLYRSVKPKEVPVPITVVVQQPSDPAPREKLLFETIADSVKASFKTLFDKIKPYLDKISAGTSSAANSVLDKLEKWIPGRCARARSLARRLGRQR
jgi:tape measure domain-containing protein